MKPLRGEAARPARPCPLLVTHAMAKLPRRDVRGPHRAEQRYWQSVATEACLKAYYDSLLLDNLFAEFFAVGLFFQVHSNLFMKSIVLEILGASLHFLRMFPEQRTWITWKNPYSNSMNGWCSWSRNVVPPGLGRNAWCLSSGRVPGRYWRT